jgi:hypothetical protein
MQVQLFRRDGSGTMIKSSSFVDGNNGMRYQTMGIFAGAHPLNIDA